MKGLFTKREVNTLAKVKAKGFEFETGFFVGWVASFLVGLMRSIAPVAMILTLCYVIPEVFSIDGSLTLASAIAVTVVTLVFTDWGAQWVDHHRRLLHWGKRKRSRNS